MRTAFQQNDAQLRFDWGLAGALAVTEPPGTAAVVVDVLSFSTTVSVAGDLGVSTFPFPWRDDRAKAFAESVGATLAGGRRQPGPSLSPASLRAVDWSADNWNADTWTADNQMAADTQMPAGNQLATDRPAARSGRLVLPSPNGSSICFALARRSQPSSDNQSDIVRIEPIDPGPTDPAGRGSTESPGLGPTDPVGPVLTGCLRNAAAIADWLVGQLTTGRLPAVGLVAAGERWPDGSLRPAVEDLWGAGAILARIARAAPQLRFAPEAMAAAAAFAAIEPELADRLAACASGRELIGDGFAADVAIAAELDSSAGVPVLDGGRFRVAPG